MPKPDPVELGDQLMVTMAATRRLVRRELRPRGIGPQLRGAQLELLRVVHDHPGIGVAAAARELCLAANSVSTLVNQLTENGMLVRQPDPLDRRAIQLYPTDLAVKRLAEWRTARAELVGAGIAALSTTDQAAIAAALPALRDLLSTLDQGEADE
ncbi:MAG TPA: MarR family transcriptional regulator [Pseudonocardiaceae bacterium]|nr:MarR family transcriptional regulator [Pseudonocardiaceae bacterium]